MQNNSKYRTKQRQSILEYLEKNSDTHLTADEIIKHFKQIDNPISKSTVYRYLDSLVDENIIRKYVSQEKQSACFQFIQNKNECNNHYHMKCIKCDKLFHLDCDSISELQRHILKNHNFEIDVCRTVLYGTCEDCLKKNNLHLSS